MCYFQLSSLLRKEEINSVHEDVKTILVCLAFQFFPNTVFCFHALQLPEAIINYLKASNN